MRIGPPTRDEVPANVLAPCSRINAPLVPVPVISKPAAASPARESVNAAGGVASIAAGFLSPTAKPVMETLVPSPPSGAPSPASSGPRVRAMKEKLASNDAEELEVATDSASCEAPFPVDEQVQQNEDASATHAILHDLPEVDHMSIAQVMRELAGLSYARKPPPTELEGAPSQPAVGLNAVTAAMTNVLAGGQADTSMASAVLAVPSSRPVLSMPSHAVGGTVQILEDEHVPVGVPIPGFGTAAQPVLLRHDSAWQKAQDHGDTLWVSAEGDADPRIILPACLVAHDTDIRAALEAGTTTTAALVQQLHPADPHAGLAAIDSAARVEALVERVAQLTGAEYCGARVFRPQAPPPSFALLPVDADLDPGMYPVTARSVEQHRATLRRLDPGLAAMSASRRAEEARVRAAIGYCSRRCRTAYGSYAYTCIETGEPVSADVFQAAYMADAELVSAAAAEKAAALPQYADTCGIDTHLSWWSQPQGPVQFIPAGETVPAVAVPSTTSLVPAEPAPAALTSPVPRTLILSPVKSARATPRSPEAAGGLSEQQESQLDAQLKEAADVEQAAEEQVEASPAAEPASPQQLGEAGAEMCLDAAVSQLVACVEEQCSEAAVLAAAAAVTAISLRSVRHDAPSLDQLTQQLKAGMSSALCNAQAPATPAQSRKAPACPKSRTELFQVLARGSMTPGRADVPNVAARSGTRKALVYATPPRPRDLASESAGDAAPVATPSAEADTTDLALAQPQFVFASPAARGISFQAADWAASEQGGTPANTMRQNLYWAAALDAEVAAGTPFANRFRAWEEVDEVVDAPDSEEPVDGVSPVSEHGTGLTQLALQLRQLSLVSPLKMSLVEN